MCLYLIADNIYEMKKILFISTILFMSSCGYQGNYRYECQDPINWEKEECNPPLCKVDGACSKDLIGFDWEEKQP